MDLRLSGKRAIVTGASRGIGRAIAGTLAREGCAVAICARQQEGVDEAVRLLQQSGVAAFGRAVDVRDSAALGGFVQAAAAALGGLDILVSNVSTRLPTGGPDWWPATFEADFHQHVQLFDMALPFLRDGADPSVVIIASIASVMAQLPAEEVAYGSMKAALVSFAGQMAAIHGKTGIRVNTVAPGPIVFPGGFWDKIREARPAMFEGAGRLAALGRLGSPQEVADCVAFLASPAASFVTGVNLRIDGGAVKTINF